MRSLKTLFAALLLAPTLAFAAGAALHLDKAPDVSGDKAALQNGAKLFVNYCLNCHGASALRYNKLLDLGLTEQQIKDNLMFATDKIGEQMKVAIRPEDAKKWFGAAPPDLSLIARARASADGSGADWLYTYLRSFYRDDKRPTGWNNVVFANVGMPHILYELQGEQVLGPDHKLTLAVPGKLPPAEYDTQIRDLVGFLVWMGEPTSGLRKQLGVAVLLFLGVLFVLAYLLKKEYWKDIH
ncbi:cytochrome c1 [Azovibrio restrictus]|uniref:cytochrome c1 n=1 Tax=Azovibrio restrictus TaxID=146938 RepID=UPI0026ED52C5|nr:cytochrome c1 [Azovibrio restrictus]MDD3483952.1 cytochrome c1 [Azovibrio restrictus]